MKPITYFCVLIGLVVTLGGSVNSRQWTRRDPGMRSDARPPPTCDVEDKGEADSEVYVYSKISSEGEPFSGCCKRHLQCYCSCDTNLSKQVCDEEFRSCLQNGCVDKLPSKGHFEMRRCSTGWSWQGPGMVNSQVANSVEFSCERYQEIQSTCCTD